REASRVLDHRKIRTDRVQRLGAQKTRDDEIGKRTRRHARSLERFEIDGQLVRARCSGDARDLVHAVRFDSVIAGLSGRFARGKLLRAKFTDPRAPSAAFAAASAQARSPAGPMPAAFAVPTIWPLRRMVTPPVTDLLGSKPNPSRSSNSCKGGIGG